MKCCVRVYVAASAATWNTTTFSKLFDYYFLLQFSLTCSFAYCANFSIALARSSQGVHLLR